jgi:hypothetical protein
MPQRDDRIDPSCTVCGNPTAKNSSEDEYHDGGKQGERVEWRYTGQLGSQHRIYRKRCGKSEHQADSDREHAELKHHLHNVGAGGTHANISAGYITRPRWKVKVVGSTEWTPPCVYTTSLHPYRFRPANLHNCFNLNRRCTLFVCAETNLSRKKRRRKARSNSFGHDTRSTRGALARNSCRGADKAAGRRQECVWYGARSGSEHSRYVYCGVPSRTGQWPSQWE